MRSSTNRILSSVVALSFIAFGSVAFADQGVQRESLDSLVARIGNDTELMELYAVHFNRPSTSVRAFVASLTPSILKEDTIFTVYALKSDPQVKQLLAGSTIFVDARERPILDAYGNPLVKPGDPTQDEAKKDDDDDGPGGAVLAGSASAGTIVLGVVGIGAVIYAAGQSGDGGSDAVPEPTSLLVMSASLGLFASARRKRNK